MNQILITNNTNYYSNNFIFKKQRKKKHYLIIFFFSISICISIIFYLIHSYFSNLNKIKITKSLKNKYNVISLYSTNNNYNVIKLSDTISIIGLIEIPKINISYPILSNSSDDLLKISVCRFAGPLPNRIGNLCIAGHNFKNSTMFSKLSQLNINDYFYITDLNNVKLEYIIYDKFKVKENNLECTKSTNNVEVTLITCNSSNNSERIVLKAKVKG